MRLLTVFLVLAFLGAGTASAGFGEKLSAAEESLPSLSSSTAEEGQAEPPASVDAKTAAVAAYSEQAPPSSDQGKLLSYDVETGAPASVYYGGKYVGWSSFTATFPATSPAFWIATSGGWSWYATVPQGGWARELMYLPIDGNVDVYEIYPSGITQTTLIGTVSKGYHYIWFNGDVPGRHITIFALNGIASNAVMVDVTSAPPSPPKPPAGAIEVGDEFTKSFSENPSTGYRWEADYDDSILTLEDDSFVPDSQGSGSGDISIETNV